LFNTLGVNDKIIVEGSAGSTSTYAIWLTFGHSGPMNSMLRVEDTGHVFGLGAVAVRFEGIDLHLVNKGLITAFDASAIVFGNQGSQFQSDITNSGVIRSDQEAITVIGALTGQNDTLVVHNTGLIEGGDRSWAYYAGTSTVKNLVTNEGFIDGGLVLGKNDDLYDGRKGKVTDGVNGLAGADTLLGGKGNDQLFGNAGSDTIVGGGGNDMVEGGYDKDNLTGGAGNDEFRFFEVVLNGSDADTIRDFSPSAKGNNDVITLSHQVFSNISVGNLASSAFKNLGSGKVDADDRIIYQPSTGHLFYDSDGSGSAARIMFADLAHDPQITYKDFLVF
jgi:Ca2+-binding RTX toxin-like protein